MNIFIIIYFLILSFINLSIASNTNLLDNTDISLSLNMKIFKIKYTDEYNLFTQKKLDRVNFVIKNNFNNNDFKLELVYRNKEIIFNNFYLKHNFNNQDFLFGILNLYNDLYYNNILLFNYKSGIYDNLLNISYNLYYNDLFLNINLYKNFDDIDGIYSFLNYDFYNKDNKFINTFLNFDYRNFNNNVKYYNQENIKETYLSLIGIDFNYNFINFKTETYFNKSKNKNIYGYNFNLDFILTGERFYFKKGSIEKEKSNNRIGLITLSLFNKNNYLRNSKIYANKYSCLLNWNILNILELNTTIINIEKSNNKKSINSETNLKLTLNF